MNLGNFFLAKNTVAQGPIGNGVTLIFDQVQYDADGQFAGNTFTNTAAGIWLFGAYIFMSGETDGNEYGWFFSPAFDISTVQSVIQAGTIYTSMGSAPVSLAAGVATIVKSFVNAGTFTVGIGSLFWGMKLA